MSSVAYVGVVFPVNPSPKKNNICFQGKNRIFTKPKHSREQKGEQLGIVLLSYWKLDKYNVRLASCHPDAQSKTSLK